MEIGRGATGRRRVEEEEAEEEEAPRRGAPPLEGTGELCMMEMGRGRGRQDDDDDDDDDCDLQGRKVIKSFFLSLSLPSFVRSLVKVSHFYIDERR